MNKITILNPYEIVGERHWRIEYEDGSSDTFFRHPNLDKRVNKNGRVNGWWLRLPENNPSHRKYLRVDELMDSYSEKESLEFPNGDPNRITSHGSTNWKSFLTEEETKEYEKAENRLAELKKIGQERASKAKADPTEKLKAEIAKKINLLKEMGLTEEQIKAILG